jgi:excisionase family DNA binding protein
MEVDKMSELLRIEQAAEQLKISPYTLRAWVRAGKIPGTKVGKNWRIDKNDILQKLGKQGTTSEEGIKNITGRDRKIINLASKLTSAGYSANETARILEIINSELKPVELRAN